MAQISVNTESLQTILKKLDTALEIYQEATEGIMSSIDAAELDGWNDNKFFAFRESFSDTRTMLLSVFDRIEEDHIPFLKKILSTSEELI